MLCEVDRQNTGDLRNHRSAAAVSSNRPMTNPQKV